MNEDLGLADFCLSFLVSGEEDRLTERKGEDKRRNAVAVSKGQDGKIQTEMKRQAVRR